MSTFEVALKSDPEPVTCKRRLSHKLKPFKVPTQIVFIARQSQTRFLNFSVLTELVYEKRSVGSSLNDSKTQDHKSTMIDQAAHGFLIQPCKKILSKPLKQDFEYAPLHILK